MVVTDDDPQQGWRFARRFAGGIAVWDEISLGRGWENTLVELFVWHAIAGPPAVPQVLLLEREVRAGQQVMRFGEPVVLARKVGLNELRAWLAEGAVF